MKTDVNESEYYVKLSKIKDNKRAWLLLNAKRDANKKNTNLALLIKNLSKTIVRIKIIATSKKIKRIDWERNGSWNIWTKWADFKVRGKWWKEIIERSSYFS